MIVDERGIQRAAQGSRQRIEEAQAAQAVQSLFRKGISGSTSAASMPSTPARQDSSVPRMA
ncbi:hypothetical protein ACFQU2_37535 [Siccirubricoccus deserti]